MIETNLKVTIDLSGLKEFQALVDDGFRRHLGPIKVAMKQWAAIFRSDMQERFEKLSQGGGEWPDLAPSTLAARRHGKGGEYKRGAAALARARATGGGTALILRDTGTLFRALTPVFGNLPGQLEEEINHGIAVGFGGAATHGTGSLSIGQLAAYHHEGGGRLPKRTLLDNPSPGAEKAMVNSMEIAIRRIERETDK